MDDNPEAQEPGEKLRRDDKGLRGKAFDEVGRIVREASQAEADGRYALASLLALHALQLDPASAEASVIFERCQAALGRKNHEVQAPGVPLPRFAPDPLLERSGPTETQLDESLFGEDALRHPIDLDGVPPLTPGPRPRGLGSRMFRAALPFGVLSLLAAGIWLASSQMQTVAPPTAPRPGVMAQAEPAENSDPVSDPRSGALGPGTVALNIIPWARVDAIYSVYDGHEIEPDGLVSPCTVSLPPGRYTFTVSHPDLGSVDLSVIVKSGEVTKVEHSLISKEDLEKELAPAIKSAGYPSGQTSESVVNQSAALRR